MRKPAPRKVAAISRRKKRRLNPKSRRVGLGVAALSFLVLLILFGKLIGFLSSLSAPYASDDLSLKRYNWNGSSTLNLAVKSDNIFVLSFNPQENTLSLLKVPEDTYVSVPLGFGRWPMRSVYDLGQAEDPAIGARLLKETISTTFGVPIDGYLILKGDFEETINQARKNPVSWLGLIKQGETDLNILERIRFWWGIKGVRFDKLEIADLGNTSLTSSSLLPDGSRGLVLDQLKLDPFIQDQFQDSKLKDESLAVGIFNATDHPALAEQAARVINNMGGRVIFTANTSERFKESLVIGEPAYTLTRLEQIFAPSCLQRNFLFFGSKAKCLWGNPHPDTAQADVNIVLGEDFYSRYNDR